jgi:tetratricopeptide (TPR) repeat protein
MIRASCLGAGLLLLAGLLSPSFAGMDEDLASCTAAKGRDSANACTRVMDSGRLPRSQFYIGYFNRGSGYRRAGDLDAALADFNRVIALNSDFARAFHARGLVRDEQDAPDKALEDFDRAIKIDDKDWGSYYSRAVLRRARQDYDGAMADIEKAAALKPKHAHVRLLHALLKADKGDYAAARDEANKVLDDGEAKAAAYYVRAFVAFDQNDLDVATTDLDKALELKDSLAPALLLKGRILEARGDKATAKSRYQQALAEPSSFIEGRSSQRKARERLNALNGVDTANAALDKPQPEKREDADVADKPLRPVGCKRFLPATGVTITIDCDK